MRFFFFFKQKTAYEMRISDCSSDVCSSDLEHLADLRRIYGYRSFSGRGARDLREWIAREAEAATSNEDLARRFVAECRRTRTILPGSSTIERLCADALVEAERRIEDLIAHRITP